MNVLLVHAHPEPQSFNGALTVVAVEALTEAGQEVEVSDLYAMGFGAVAGAEDFSDRLDRDCFRLDREQAHAHENGSTAPDIVAEQAKLARADLLVLQYPMWCSARRRSSRAGSAGCSPAASPTCPATSTTPACSAARSHPRGDYGPDERLPGVRARSGLQHNG